MTDDARFEDGAEQPLRLKAMDADDLPVVSALTQDAVFQAGEMRWERRQRRFSILLNRFRWEDKPVAERRNREFERVKSVLSIADVIAVQSQGVDGNEGDMVLSLLAVDFQAGEDGTGRIELTLAGDGAIGIDVEALDVILQDVTRPYVAPSRKVPDHSG